VGTIVTVPEAACALIGPASLTGASLWAKRVTLAQFKLGAASSRYQIRGQARSSSCNLAVSRPSWQPRRYTRNEAASLAVAQTDRRSAMSAPWPTLDV
jgi:hypothetical protein